MIYLRILILVCLLNSCDQQKKKESNEISKTNKIHQTSNSIKIDSVKIHFLSFTKAVDAKFTINNEGYNINGSNLHGDFKQKNNHGEEHSQLINYINLFYIKKTEEIVFSQSPSPESDYPVIEVTGFLNDDIVFAEKEVLFDNTEFNPIYLEFYNFLNDLLSKIEN